MNSMSASSVAAWLASVLLLPPLATVPEQPLFDRPVLGGNASSEVRMWICGAHGKGNKETGILEEIQLDNQRYNPSLSHSIWDGILWGKVSHQPNLTPFLNTSCLDAQMDGASQHGN